MKNIKLTVATILVLLLFSLVQAQTKTTFAGAQTALDKTVVILDDTTSEYPMGAYKIYYVQKEGLVYFVEEAQTLEPRNSIVFRMGQQIVLSDGYIRLNSGKYEYGFRR